MSAARHRLGGQFRHQITQISVAGDYDEFGPDLTLRRVHHRIRTALDTHGRRLLVDRPAQGLDRRRFTQRQVERVDVAATHVQHPADVLITRHHFANAALIHQLELGVAESLPQALLRLQMTHLLGGHRGEHATVLQIALDVVPGDPLTNDPATFKRHLPQQLSLLGADCALDDIDVAAIAVNDLPAITPGRPETHLGGLKHRDLETVLQQKQGRGQPRVTGANHTDIGLDVILQRRARRNRIGRCGVIGFWVGSVSHPAASV
ncbi:hypothetical protein D3C78_888440 [compost metagenome]